MQLSLDSTCWQARRPDLWRRLTPLQHGVLCVLALTSIAHTSVGLIESRSPWFALHLLCWNILVANVLVFPLAKFASQVLVLSRYICLALLGICALAGFILVLLHGSVISLFRTCQFMAASCTTVFVGILLKNV